MKLVVLPFAPLLGPLSGSNTHRSIPQCKIIPSRLAATSQHLFFFRNHLSLLDKMFFRKNLLSCPVATQEQKLNLLEPND